jgi:hypothetical protein
VRVLHQRVREVGIASVVQLVLIPILCTAVMRYSV